MIQTGATQSELIYTKSYRILYKYINFTHGVNKLTDYFIIFNIVNASQMSRSIIYCNFKDMIDKHNLKYKWKESYKRCAVYNK